MAECDITLGLKADFNATALHIFYTFVHDFSVSQINKLKEKTNARKEL